MVREAKPLQNNFFPLSYKGEGDLEGEVEERSKVECHQSMERVQTVEAQDNLLL